MRVLLAVLPALAMVLGGPAAAKAESQAWLKTDIPLGAAPGTSIRIEWQVLDREGGPFNAIGMFVRLISASGAKATEGSASADAHPTGDYEANVPIPEGGIGGIEFGLAGTASGPSIPAHRSDMIFPLMNGIWTTTAIQAGPLRRSSDQIASSRAPNAASPATPGTDPATTRTPSDIPRPLAADWGPRAFVLVSLACLGALLAVAHRVRRTSAG